MKKYSRLVFRKLVLSILPGFFLVTSIYGQYKAKVNLHFDHEYSGDTIHMEITSFIPQNDKLVSKQIYTAILDHNGHASILLDLKHQYAYFFLGRDFNVGRQFYLSLINNFLIGKGDDITINVKYDSWHSPRFAEGDTPGIYETPVYTLSFSGKGSEKFKCYYSSEHPAIRSAPGPNIPTFDKEGIFNINSSEIKLGKEKISRTLLLARGKMDDLAYQILKADMAGTFLWGFGRVYYKTAPPGNTGTSGFEKNPGFKSIIKELSQGLSEYAKKFSKNYVNGVLEVLVTDFTQKHGDYKTGEFSNFITTDYSGDMRDQLLYLFIKRAAGGLMRDSDSVIKNCIAVIKNPIYKKEVENMQSRIKGATAYDFSLPDSKGNVVTLSSLIGKVVFVDFYFLGCAHCQEFYEHGVKKAEEYFQNDTNVVFVAISVDANEATWKKALNSGLYTSTDAPNVINLYTDGEGAEHPVVKRYNIIAYPCPIIIDKKGKIAEYDLRQRDKDFLMTEINSTLNEK